MKDDLAELALALMALAVGGAAEELLPRCCGIGFPVLLAATVFFARSRGAAVRLAFAAAAGVFEDALSGLPVGTSAVFFMLVAFLARHAAVAWALVAYPLYEVWLAAWTLRTGAFASRFAASLLLGAACALGVGLLFSWAERRAALR